MAGTDRSRGTRAHASDVLAPVVVLVEPQLGENIGTAARAMLNFGLTEMRLVRPRDGWPSEKALSASSGAVEVIEGARLFETTAEAVADLETVYATTARPRDMIKTVLTPAEAGTEIGRRGREDVRCGVLFGPERFGLSNDDVALADAIIAFPCNPAFASFNLAMAVLVIGYEWFKQADHTPERELVQGRTRPATKDELIGFFEHLERELDACGFLRVVEKRPSMVRNIRNIFQRAELTEQEVRTLRGIVAGLATHPRRPQSPQSPENGGKGAD